MRKALIFKKISFGLKEAVRNLRLNSNLSKKFFKSILVLNFLVSFTYIFIFNLNFFAEKIITHPTPDSVLSSLIPGIFRISQEFYIPYILLGIIVTCLTYINVSYSQKYLSDYEEEIELMNRVNGSKKIIKLPLLYLVFIVNFTAVILVWFFSILSYNLIENINLFLLGFSQFKITLFFFLLITCIGISVFTTYYLFWSYYHY